MSQATNNRQATQPRQKRSVVGCTSGCLTIIILILVIASAGWIFLLRPYLHNIAATQIDNALSTGVQQIPTTLPALPTASLPLPIQESTINNLFVLNLAPNNPIKNPTTQITADGIQVGFQLYGIGNTISLKPALQNGRMVATNVNLSGPFSWIMSPDELTPILNRHLADAQNRIKYPIQNIQLKDHEMDVTIGSAQAQ